MDWDDARTEAVRFFRGLLGTGYIDEYYEAPADELIEILKMVESQSTPEATSQPTTAESVVNSMTFAEAEALLVKYQREKLERQRRG